MIIANHAHLMPPQNAAIGWPAGGSDLLLKHLDFCGIDKAVVFPPFGLQFDGDRMKANRWAIGECRRHADRFIPAGTISPPAPDAAGLLRLLHEEGIRQAKVHPSMEHDAYDIADPAAVEGYALAQELGIALDFHTGPHWSRLSHTQPIKYDDLAWDYPELKLVFEHIGGRVWFQEFTAVIANHPKREVFGGLTSVLATEANPMWFLGPERIMDFIRSVGAGKLIYGLDFPWNSPETSRQDIEIIRSLDITTEEKELILGGNLAGLLQLEVGD